MNHSMISQLQAEQTIIENSEEYRLDQQELRLDALLERINALLKASHEDDKAFARYLRKAHRDVILCDQCRKEVL